METLDKMLRDWLVWGIRDKYIQKKLLPEAMLTQKDALWIAQSAETAEKNLCEMEIESYKEVVHFVKRQHQPKKHQSRQRQQQHSSQPQNAVYHRRRHLQRMCRSADAGSSNPSGTAPTRRAGVKQVRESEDSESEADDLWLVEQVGGIHKLYQPPIKVPVCVDGVNETQYQ